MNTVAHAVLPSGDDLTIFRYRLVRMKRQKLRTGTANVPFSHEAMSWQTECMVRSRDHAPPCPLSLSYLTMVEQRNIPHGGAGHRQTDTYLIMHAVL